MTTALGVISKVSENVRGVQSGEVLPMIVEDWVLHTPSCTVPSSTTKRDTPLSMVSELPNCTECLSREGFLEAYSESALAQIYHVVMARTELAVASPEDTVTAYFDLKAKTRRLEKSSQAWQYADTGSLCLLAKVDLQHVYRRMPSKVALAVLYQEIREELGGKVDETPTLQGFRTTSSQLLERLDPIFETSRVDKDNTKHTVILVPRYVADWILAQGASRPEWITEAPASSDLVEAALTLWQPGELYSTTTLGALADLGNAVQAARDIHR